MLYNSPCFLFLDLLFPFIFIFPSAFSLPPFLILYVLFSFVLLFLHSLYSCFSYFLFCFLFIYLPLCLLFMPFFLPLFLFLCILFVPVSLSLPSLCFFASVSSLHFFTHDNIDLLSIRHALISPGH